jgi:hypothetical protein
MTFIRTLDLAVQLLLIVVAFVFTIVNGIDLSLILSVQLGLGFVQMLSSLISVAKPGPFFKAKAAHFIGAVLYLGVLFLVLPLLSESTVGFQLLLLLPSWVLAFYYLYLTYKRVALPPPSRGKFLPHINF